MATSSRRHSARRSAWLTVAPSDGRRASDAVGDVVVPIDRRRRRALEEPSTTWRFADPWTDRWVLDPAGALLGLTVGVVVDPQTDQAVLLAVYTGAADATVVVVPVHGCALRGDDIVIDAHRASVLAAPPIELAVGGDPAWGVRRPDHVRHAAVLHAPTPPVPISCPPGNADRSGVDASLR